MVTMGGGHGGGRRDDAETPLTVRADVFVLQLQLQLAVDDRLPHRLRCDLRDG